MKALINSKFIRITADSSTDSVLHTMLEREEGDAVVVHSVNLEKMIGFITKADVLRAYELAIARLGEEGEPIETIHPLSSKLESIEGFD